MNRSISPYIRKPNQLLSGDDQIKIIMKEFDFEKVNRAMTLLDWQWFGVGRVPTIEEIKEVANRLLNDVWNVDEDDSQFYTMGIGGLEAYKFVYDGLKYLELKFELCSWGLEYDDVQITYDEYYRN